MSALKELLVHEFFHFLVAVLYGCLVYLYTEQLFSAFLVTAVAFFLDGDHLLDYQMYLREKRQKFGFGEFLSGCYFKKTGKIYIFLHSFELAFILTLSGLIFDASLLVYIAFAMVLHMCVDLMTNKVHLMSYFLIYRYTNNFLINAICKH